MHSVEFSKISTSRKIILLKISTSRNCQLLKIVDSSKLTTARKYRLPETIKFSKISTVNVVLTSRKIWRQKNLHEWKLTWILVHKLNRLQCFQSLLKSMSSWQSIMMPNRNPLNLDHHLYFLVDILNHFVSPKFSKILSVTKKILPVLIEVILSVLISNCWFVSSANFTSQLWLDNWLFFPQIVFMPRNKQRIPRNCSQDFPGFSLTNCEPHTSQPMTK